jgi:hypothetical protein
LRKRDKNPPGARRRKMGLLEQMTLLLILGSMGAAGNFRISG